MASPIEATMLLADAAVADPTGKIHMLGAGWSVTTSPTAPSAVAVFLRIPWDRTNTKIPCTLELVDADGHAVSLGNGQPGIRVDQIIEVGRPPGLEPGTPIDASFQISVGILPLKPGRYQWRLKAAEGEWSISFTVQSSQSPRAPSAH
jgi:hypothetical protein